MRTLFTIVGLLVTFQSRAATLRMCEGMLPVPFSEKAVESICEPGKRIIDASGDAGGVALFSKANHYVGEADALISPTDLLQRGLDPEGFAQGIVESSAAITIYCRHDLG